MWIQKYYTDWSHDQNELEDSDRRRFGGYYEDSNWKCFGDYDNTIVRITTKFNIYKYNLETNIKYWN